MSWKLKKQMMDILGQEDCSLTKDWGGKTTVALLYPNTYRIGMGNLAVHSIYRMLNARPGIVCERAFLPEPRSMGEYASNRTPILSIESQQPISEFDWIIISTSFENDYLNLSPIFEMCRIPLRAENRGKEMPVVIAGGAAPTLNPLPLSLVADAVVMGEIEAYSGDLIPLIESHTDKNEIIETLSNMKGVVRAGAPSLSIPSATRPRHIAELDSVKTETVIYSRNAEFGDMHLIEVERGCPRRCLFCATPAIYGGHRQRNARSVIAMIEDGLPYRKRFGLIGSDILSHPEFIEIAKAIHAHGSTFSPSSVRADAINEEKAQLLAESGHKSIALGIETGSEKLRKTLGKGIADEQVLTAVAFLAKAGITRLRLYFMIGLPNETDEDITAIVKISEKIRNEMRKTAPKSARTTSVDLTVTPFVPKPKTAFAKELFAGKDELKRKIKELHRSFAKQKGISMHTDSIKDASLEYRLANSGIETIELLEHAIDAPASR